MKHFKILILLTNLAVSLSTMASPIETRTYGIHLHFNETEFVDVMTLEQADGGGLTGHMYVPNDFDGKLDHLTQDKNHLSFDLLVPKNASRPKDLVFHYDVQFFNSAQEQLTGYVTIRGGPGFVASLVGFVRK